jgi:hypothetical protein
VLTINESGSIVSLVNATTPNGETTMTTYQIISSAGVDMGTFEGETEAEALDAMARDAGYRDQAEAAEVAGPFDGTVEAVE